jgi:hypothetical protein
MAGKERAVDSVAEAYLTLLAERGVEYLFANSGTDFAPAQMSHGRTTPGGPRASRSRVGPRRGNHRRAMRRGQRRSAYKRCLEPPQFTRLLDPHSPS